MDRNRIKSKLSSIRQLRGLNKGKQKAVKLLATKKARKRDHGHTSVPAELKRLTTTDGFWSSPQDFRTSRSSSLGPLKKVSDTIKDEVSKSLSSKNNQSQKAESSSTERKTSKQVKVNKKDASAGPSASLKSTTMSKRPQTTKGILSPGTASASTMPVRSDFNKGSEKEKDTTVIRSFPLNLMELKRLQTTDGFWSPNIAHPSPRHSSRDTSPSSTCSSLERGARRSTGKLADMKKNEEDSKGKEAEKSTNDSALYKRTRSATSIMENDKSDVTAKAKPNVNDAGFSSPHLAINEPSSKRVKLAGKKSKDNAVALKRGKTPSPAITPPSVGRKRLSKSKTNDSTPIQKAAVSSRKSSANTSKDKINISDLSTPVRKAAAPFQKSQANASKDKINISDLLNSNELKRLNTTDGFWSPLPKMSYMFIGSRQNRMNQKQTGQPQSQLLEHRKRKLRSLKLNARSVTQQLPSRRPSKPDSAKQQPVIHQNTTVPASHENTLPTSLRKRKRRKGTKFTIRKQSFLKKEQSGFVNTVSSSKSVVDRVDEKASPTVSKHGSMDVKNSSQPLKSTQPNLKGERRLRRKRDQSGKEASNDSESSSKQRVGQTQEVPMECEEKVVKSPTDVSAEDNHLRESAESFMKNTFVGIDGASMEMKRQRTWKRGRKPRRTYESSRQLSTVLRNRGTSAQEDIQSADLRNRRSAVIGFIGSLRSQRSSVFRGSIRSRGRGSTSRGSYQPGVRESSRERSGISFKPRFPVSMDAMDHSHGVSAPITQDRIDPERTYTTESRRKGSARSRNKVSELPNARESRGRLRRVVKVSSNTIVNLSPETKAKASDKTLVKTSPETMAKLSPETMVEASLEVLVKTSETAVTASPETMFEASPETMVEASPETMVEASLEALVKTSPETTVKASPEITVKASPETMVEASPETTVKASPETMVEASPETTVKASPETMVEASPETTVKASSETMVEASPETTVKASSEAMVEASPETTVKASPETTVKASVETMVKVPLETLVKTSPETTVKASPETTVKASPQTTVKTSETTVTASPETTVKTFPETMVNESHEEIVKVSFETNVKESPETMVKTPETVAKMSPEHCLSAENHSNIFDIMEQAKSEIGTSLDSEISKTVPQETYFVPAAEKDNILSNAGSSLAALINKKSGGKGKEVILDITGVVQENEMKAEILSPVSNAGTHDQGGKSPVNTLEVEDEKYVTPDLEDCTEKDICHTHSLTDLGELSSGKEENETLMEVDSKNDLPCAGSGTDAVQVEIEKNSFHEVPQTHSKDSESRDKHSKEEPEKISDMIRQETCEHVMCGNKGEITVNASSQDEPMNSVSVISDTDATKENKFKGDSKQMTQSEDTSTCEENSPVADEIEKKYDAINEDSKMLKEDLSAKSGVTNDSLPPEKCPEDQKVITEEETSSDVETSIMVEDFSSSESNITEKQSASECITLEDSESVKLPSLDKNDASASQLDKEKDKNNTEIEASSDKVSETLAATHSPQSCLRVINDNQGLRKKSCESERVGEEGQVEPEVKEIACSILTSEESDVLLSKKIELTSSEDVLKEIHSEAGAIIPKQYPMRSRPGSQTESRLLPEDSRSLSPKKAKAGQTSPQNPLQGIRKRRRFWSKGVVRKVKHAYPRHSTTMRETGKTGPSHKRGRPRSHLQVQPSNIAELAMQATKIFNVSPDSDKPKKLMNALKRLKTDANLANASLNNKRLQTRARKGLYPMPNLGLGKGQKMHLPQDKGEVLKSLKNVNMESAFLFSGNLVEAEISKEVSKLEEPALPKLSPLGLAPSTSDVHPVDPTPPVLTPQQPIDFFTRFGEGVNAAVNLEDEIVNESVDDTDFHLYLSETSDDDDTSDAQTQNQGTTNLLVGTSKTNQGKSVQTPVLNPPETETNAALLGSNMSSDSGSLMPATPVPHKPKMKGKRGKPPGIPVSQRDIFVQPSKTARKSIKSSTPVRESTGPLRTFEFRKKTTRSPLQMLEMKRKQEEAIYDLEMEKIQARKIIRREKRIARLPTEAYPEDELSGLYDLKPCSVVLSDFVKKLNLDQSVTDFCDNMPSSPYLQFEDDLGDEDWCADLEEVDDDEDFDESIEKREHLKRPHIPRLKLKRVSKRGKLNIGTAMMKNLVSEMKSPEQEPLKLVIKTEVLSDIEEPSKSASTEPQGSTVFENHYLEFLKNRSPINSPPSKESNLASLHHSSSSTSKKDKSKSNKASHVSSKSNSSGSVPALVQSSPETLEPSTSTQEGGILSQPFMLASGEDKDTMPTSESKSSSENATPNKAEKEQVVTELIPPTLPERVDMNLEEEEDMLILDLNETTGHEESLPVSETTASNLNAVGQSANESEPQSGVQSQLETLDAQENETVSDKETEHRNVPKAEDPACAQTEKSTLGSDEASISSMNAKENEKGIDDKITKDQEPSVDPTPTPLTKENDDKEAGIEKELRVSDAKTSPEIKACDSKKVDAAEIKVDSQLKLPADMNAMPFLPPADKETLITKNIDASPDRNTSLDAIETNTLDVGKEKAYNGQPEKQVMSADEPSIEAGEATTKVTPSEPEKETHSESEEMDASVSQEPADTLASSNNNNNNNNVKLTTTSNSNSADSSSPVHSTSQDPKEDMRKLKKIPPNYKQMSGSYKCKRCGFTAVSKFSIESHIYSHIPEVHFQCVVCDSEFSSMTAISNHFKSSHVNADTEFYISRFVDESNFYSISKENDETVTSQITSGPDGQQHPLIISLIVSGGGARPQIRPSTASRRFVCTHCGFSTNFKEDVEQHISDLHSTQTLFTCTLCKNYVGLSEADIKEHSASVHPSRQRPYVKLPDFYDADQLVMMEKNGSSEDREASVLVSARFPRNETSTEETPSGLHDHQRKAKDYLLLQEGWRGKTSAEADSTTAMDENLASAANDSDKTRQEGEGSSEANPCALVGGASESNVTDVGGTESGVSQVKIADVVSLTGRSQVEDIGLSTNAAVPSPQTTTSDEVNKDHPEMLTETLSPAVTSSSLPNSPKTVISDSSVAQAAANTPPASMLSSTSLAAAMESTFLSTASSSSSSLTESHHTDESKLRKTATSNITNIATSEKDSESQLNTDTAKSIVSPPVTSFGTSSPIALTSTSLPLSEGVSKTISVSTMSLHSSLSESGKTTTSSSAALPTTPQISPSQASPLLPTDTMSSSVPLPEGHRHQKTSSTDTESSKASTNNASKSMLLSQSPPSSSLPSSSSSSSSSVTGGLPLSYQCKACKVHTPYLLMMVRHLKSRHPKILCFSCPYCKSTLSFNTQKQLRQHVRSMHPEKADKNEMSLSEEAKKFVEAMVLPKSPQCTRVGNRLILEEDIHTCTVCSLRMTSLSSVYDHLNEKHSDLFEFVCPSCQSYKNKSLQNVADHCMMTHQSELDKDKVHVSVPKYLFTILSCISKQGKYIEKALLSPSSSPSKDPSCSSKDGGAANASSKEDTPAINTQPPKTQGMSINREPHHQIQTSQSVPAPLETPAPPPAHCIPPSTISMAPGIPLNVFMSPAPIVAIPIVAPTSIAATTRSVVAISSSLFDTSSLSAPRLSGASANVTEASPSGNPQRGSQATSQQRAAKSHSLPVLNVPTIRPRSTSVIKHPPTQARPSSRDTSKLRASSTPLNDPTSASAPANQLPEDEPSPDAFKIFNLRPAGMTPPVMASPSPVPQGTPSVFPPVSSSVSLPSGFIPGPMAGFPAAMVIPPALIHSAFPFAAATVAHPLRVVADGSKRQGKYPPVQSFRQPGRTLPSQLPSSHLQKLSSVTQQHRHLFQVPQHQHQQQAAQHTTAGSVGTPPSHRGHAHTLSGQNHRYSHSAAQPSPGMIAEQRLRQTSLDSPGPAQSSPGPSTSHFMSSHPVTSAQSMPSPSLNPMKKGRKSNTLYRCPYCANSQPLKALEVASHIRHAHPGCQVYFQKAT